MKVVCGVLLLFLLFSASVQQAQLHWDFLLLVQQWGPSFCASQVPFVRQAFFCFTNKNQRKAHVSHLLRCLPFMDSGLQTILPPGSALLFSFFLFFFFWLFGCAAFTLLLPNCTILCQATRMLWLALVRHNSSSATCIDITQVLAKPQGWEFGQFLLGIRVQQTCMVSPRKNQKRMFSKNKFQQGNLRTFAALSRWHL